MKYILQRHKNDRTMIEATYNWTSKISGKKSTILAFVIHEDCLEDDDIKSLIDQEGSTEIEFSLPLTPYR